MATEGRHRGQTSRMRTARGAPPSHALCASLPARGARPARQGVRVGFVRVAGRGSRHPVTRAPPRSRPVSARESVRVPCGPGRGTPEREGQPEVEDLRKERPQEMGTSGEGVVWSRRALSPIPCVGIGPPLMWEPDLATSGLTAGYMPSSCFAGLRDFTL